MNFNTFSSLYSVSNATASFSGSGHNSALVQAAQNYGLSFTIVTGSNVGDTLQLTSSFGSIITASGGFSTSSFNRTTASLSLLNASQFQNVLIRGEVQGTNATTPIIFSSPISGSELNVCDISACHITASGNISASGDIVGATFGDSAGNIVFTGNVSGSGTNSSYFGAEYHAHGNDANSGFTILSLTTKPIISAVNSELLIGGVVEPEIPTKLNSNNVQFAGAITASGNISASNDIIADKFIIDKGAATGSSLQVLGDGVLLLSNKTGGQLNKISLKAAEIDDSSSNNTSFRLGGRIKVGQGTSGVDPNHQHEVSGSLNVTGSIVMVGDVNFTNLPSSDPGVAGRLYRDGGTVKVSL